MNVAIIPARGGSKRIPRKNIRPFAGKPMIGYAIEAALSCGQFDRVIVTTDDDEIAAVAQAHGAELPFRRPSELADDHTPTVPVIQHAIRACNDLGWDVGYACCIYPGVPFIRAADIACARSNGGASACVVASAASQRWSGRRCGNRIPCTSPSARLARILSSPCSAAARGCDTRPACAVAARLPADRPA